MEADELLTVGNITTIISWVVNIILPYVACYGIDKDVLTSLIFTGLWFAFCIYNSANPNTFAFLGNALKKCSIGKDDDLSDEELVLNDEYVSSDVDESEGC